MESSNGQWTPEPLSGLRRTTLTALLLALYMAIDAIPSPAGGILKFSGFILVLSGFLVGPWGGALVGGLGDLLTYALHPKGPFFPGFTLTSALTGCLPALFLGSRNRTLFNLGLSIAGGQVITKLLLVPCFLQYVYGLPALAWALRAAGEQAVHIPLYAYAACVILPHWERYRRRREEF